MITLDSKIELRHRIVAAMRDIRAHASVLHVANGPDPSGPRPSPSPSPSPGEPNEREMPEPKRYPIHPDIPVQPIHEPIEEPSQTPVEGP